MARILKCEVMTGKGWTSMAITDYLTLRESGGRCPECKGPVRAHKRSVNGMAAHFEHLKKNGSCSLSDSR